MSVSRLGDEAAKEQLRRVRDLRSRAAASGWQPLQTELRRTEGGVLIGLGKTEDGISILNEVWLQLAEASEWERATSLASYLSSVESLSNADVDGARLWLDLAKVCLKHAYDPSNRLGLRVMESELELERLAGDGARAETLAREFLEGRRRIYGWEHVRVADAQTALAGVLSSQARHEESVALRKQAIETQLRLFGENRRSLIFAYQSLSRAQRWMGDLAAAKSNLQRAHEIALRIAPEDPEISKIVLGLAVSAQDEGDLGTAEMLAEEAAAIGRRGFGDDHPKMIDLLSALADLKRLVGKPLEALKLYREAETVGRETLGARNQQTRYPRGRACMLLAEYGEREDGLRYCRKLASFLLEGEAEGLVDFGQMGVGRALHLTYAFVDLDVAEDAVFWGRRVVEIADAQAGDESLLYAYAKTAQGRALALAGKLRDAKSAVETALAVARAKTVKEAGDDLSAIWEGRAEVYVAAGEYDVALADYQEAIRRSGYEARIANYRAAVERLCREKNYEPACGIKSSR